MKQVIRFLLRRLGYDIIRLESQQHGQQPLSDMRQYLTNDEPIIFDVGANIGQSIFSFREILPQCQIHSFEPSPDTFETLKNNAADLNDVSLWNCALGSSPGKLPLLENSDPDMSSFYPIGEFGWGEIVSETSVEVKTIDQVCQDESISKIDILKSDTQGFDLNVFKGAEQTLSANKIGLIYFETIFSEIYRDLPSFGKIYDFLIDQDFRLVSFYNFHFRKKIACWADALFVHRSLVPDN